MVGEVSQNGGGGGKRAGAEAGEEETAEKEAGFCGRQEVAFVPSGNISTFSLEKNCYY